MILITGASGAMGRVLTERLHEKGELLRACVVPEDPNVGRIARFCADIRYADIADAASLVGICKGIDIVYHLAAIIISNNERDFTSVNREGTRNLVEEAKRQGVGHFIYISSASVVYPHPTPYSLSKRKAEEIVVNSGIPYTIIRPTLVYGKKGGLEFDRYLQYLKQFPIVPFIGNGKSLKRPVFVEDIISGLVALLGNKNVFGKIYNFSGAQSISMLDFTRLCLVLLHCQHKTILRIPVWLCKLIAEVMACVMKKPPLTWQVIAGITQDADLDPSLAMREIGYSPAGVSLQLPKCFPRLG
jgi:NADH dehydrogenase